MRVIVADDHPLFREGLRLLLHNLGKGVEIEEASDFASVLSHVNRAGKSVDVVLLDLNMPGMDWRQAIGELLTKGLIVVAISATVNSDIVKEVMAMGGSGFIPKICNSKVIRGALRQVLSGGIYHPSAILLNRPLPRPFPHAVIAETRAISTPYLLTRRQLDVLSRMAGGLSNKGIARALELAEGTVKLHVTAILKSLGVSNRTQAVMIAWRSGILTEENLSIGKQEPKHERDRKASPPQSVRL